MYIKVVGAVFCAVGSFVYGYYLSCMVIERIRNLQYIKEVLMILISNIEQGYSSIPEILMRISKDAKNESFINFFGVVAKKLKEDINADFKSCWSGGVKEHLVTMNFTENDIEIINHIGDLPLYLDGDTQVRQIKQVIRELDFSLDNARQEAVGKCKVYKCSGAAIGLMIVLVMI